MMQHHTATLLAFIALAAPVAWAGTSLSAEQAWELAQQHSDAPLSPTPLAEPYADGDADTLQFRTEPDVRPMRVHRVNVVRGNWVGFDQARPYAKLAEPATESDAIAAARAEAERHAPDAARLMKWTTESHLEDWSRVRVEGAAVPSEGAPQGPVSRCSVTYDLDTGAIHRYTQILLEPHVPAPVQPRVTAEQAGAIATRHLRDRGVRGTSTPKLWAPPAGPEWHLEARTDSGHCMVSIDAMTGAIRDVGWFPEAADMDKGGGLGSVGTLMPSDRRALARALLLPLVVATTLGLLSLVIVLRRRR